MNTDALKLLAKDLAKDYPRSPRETLAEYVIAGRVLDKCRAFVNGTISEYLFNCPLDQRFFEFAEIDAEAFKNFVASGATDADVAEWITKNAKQRPRIEIIKWNNYMRDLRVSE